jgi:GTP-binding protein Era
MNNIEDLLQQLQGPSGHQSGFVNIIGRPNVGKSTLMNALVGERMSIITNKPQTTRHRIFGIVSGHNFQIVFSDTPGAIKDPSYKMQERMNRFVESCFDDADIMLFVTEVGEPFPEDMPIFARLEKLKCPLYLIVNKIDQFKPDAVKAYIDTWQEKLKYDKVFPISALERTGTGELMKSIVDNLPLGPPYFPTDQLTDRPERFFVSEIIREKILLHYYYEIPYSVQIVVESYKHDPDKDLVRISAIIYVMRESQKNIIIGPKGKDIKKVGIDARKDIEAFTEKQVFLELFVKVRDNWRDDEKQLSRFGYE